MLSLSIPSAIFSLNKIITPGQLSVPLRAVRPLVLLSSSVRDAARVSRAATVFGEIIITGHAARKTFIRYHFAGFTRRNLKERRLIGASHLRVVIKL